MCSCPEFTVHTPVGPVVRELSLNSLLDRVDELPEVSHTAFQVIQLLNDPDLDVHHLAELISTDQVLTTKVLRLCNSAYYGLARHVSTISEAVRVVGFSALKSMVFMITTQNTQNKGLIGYRISAHDFWEHSIATAAIARILVQSVGYSEPEEAFIGGLIHDIGKLVLNQGALPEVYKASQLSQQAQILLYQAENRVLSFNHAQVGAALLERWNFPPVLIAALRYHHTFECYLEHDRVHPLPTAVATANLLATMLKASDERARSLFRTHAEVIAEVLQVCETDLEELLPRCQFQIEETRQMALMMS
jgi:putative nucleotidyltransferase with HDIG domain